MKYNKNNLLTLVILCFMSTLAHAQWNKKYLPSQYFPTNDVKSHGGKLYAATNNGIFSSTDNGNNWTDLTQGFATSGGSSYKELIFTKNGNIYARTSINGVVRSTNGGSSWEYDTTNIGLSDIKAIYYDSISDKIFIGLTYPKYGIHFKKPGDAAWTKITSTAFVNNLAPIQITKKGTEFFMVDVSKNVYESSDGGDTWVKKTATNIGDVSASDGAGKFIAIDNDLYLAGNGLFKSSNDGDSWTRIDTGFALSFNLYVDIRGMFYDGTNIYASVYNKHVYRSPDKGQTWIDLGEVHTFLISYTWHNGTLYGAGFGSDSIYIFGSGTIGISKPVISKDPVLYPNPMKDKASIKLYKDLSQGTLRIYNMQGQLISEITDLHGKEVSIDRKDMSTGIYFYQLSEGGRLLISGKLQVE